jgi:hypothetical protein
VTLYKLEGHSFDTCFVGSDQNDRALASAASTFPLLIVGKEAIRKVGMFSKTDLEKAFQSPIKLDGMRRPVDYYPFSENDHDAVIIPRVLRMIIQVALSRARGGPSALAQTTFNSEEIVSKIHPYWEALSKEHRNVLTDRVRKLIQELIAGEDKLREELGDLEGKKGYKISGTLQSLADICEKIIEKYESPNRMTFYMQS